MTIDTERDLLVKDHVVEALPLRARWLWLAVAGAVACFLAALLADEALPPALARGDAPPDRFIAQTAYEHLLNLTSIGPRVAGSYENEVLAVNVLVSAVKEIARTASPHNRVELDVFRSDGAFSLTFLDGMNNIYRGVSSVVVRVSGRGAPASARRAALLFNCHFDTVPDSAGASDDGAGCAVLLETLRALAASPRPLRHDAVFLLNGAEENILQAAHGFITQHAWARSVRAFLNVEACGAGGREVVFQAGPRAPWLVEAYARAAPRPFASSLAQELFLSGLIPADTDFRIFRDFGNLSGLDLAWSADGYVYHTRLDAADRVPPAALQRTGDNLLALAHELLWSEELASSGDSADSDDSQPVFFDVVGVWTVTARAPAAAAVALATLALVALELRRAANHARAELCVRGRAWCAAVGACGACVLAAGAAGVAHAAAVAALLYVTDRRLMFYARPWLLLPLYVLPGIATSWTILCRLLGGIPLARGWWRARLVQCACMSISSVVLAACMLVGLRSGFIPLLWALGPALGLLLCPRRAGGPARLLLGALGAAPAALLTSYLCVGTLRMLVPLAGRGGAGAVPADAVLAAAATALALAQTCLLLPPVVTSRGTAGAARLAWLASVLALALVFLSPGAYSPRAPQRLMLFHTRRTEHARTHARTEHARTTTTYWIPGLDDNTPHSLQAQEGAVGALGSATAVGEEECSRWLWCGAPYYLPVRSFIARSYSAPAHTEPRAKLSVTIHEETRGPRDLVVRLEMAGTQHVVVIAAPAAGARLLAAPPLPAPPLAAPRWGRRRVYFYTLHDARAPAPFNLTLHVQHEEDAPADGERLALSVAGHALFGSDKLATSHAQLLAALPAWVAPTGWGVDLHLYSV